MEELAEEVQSTEARRGIVVHDLDDLQAVMSIKSRHHRAREEAVLEQRNMTCDLVRLLGEQRKPVLLLSVEPHLHLTVAS